jgi:hypothetical protein
MPPPLFASSLWLLALIRLEVLRPARAAAAKPTKAKHITK